MNKNNKNIKKTLIVIISVLLIFGRLIKTYDNFKKVDKQKEEFNKVLYDNDLSGIDLKVLSSERITENLPSYIKDDEIYVKVNLKITNNSNKAFDFSWLRCYAVDENGEEMRADGFVDLNGLQEVIIESGESIDGFVSFKINKDNNIKMFKYYKGIMSKKPAFEFEL